MSKEIVERNAASQITHVFIGDSASSTGAGKTGILFNSAGLQISVMRPGEAAPTIYSTTAGTIEDITTIGTYQAPTATKCRFKQIDATNLPGWYEIHFADALYNATGSRRSLGGMVFGASGAVPCPFQIQLSDPAAGVGSPTNLDAAVSTRASGAALTSAANAIIALLPTALVGGKMDSHVADLVTLEEMTEGVRDVARAGAAVGSVGEAINLILSKTDTEIDGLVTSIATLTTDIATILASVTPEVASILAAVGVIQAKTDQMQFTNENKVDAALVAVEDLLAAVANKIADHVRRRSQASVESSPDGDALSVGSEYGFIQQAQKSTNNGTGLDVKKTTGAALGTLPLTTDENAEPITGVG